MCKGWGIKPSQPLPQGVVESVYAPTEVNKTQTHNSNDLDSKFYEADIDFSGKFDTRYTVDFSTDTSDLGEDTFSRICDDKLEASSARNSVDFSEEATIFPPANDDKLRHKSPVSSNDTFEVLTFNAAKLETTDEVVANLGKEEVFEGVSTQDDGVGGVRTASHEVSTLTDVCYQDGLAEVDLVSLIEEQLPKYVLRADTITDFTGYDNADWAVKTPALDPNTDLDLSPELIEETLKYFVLCSERVGQMTRTYNDIEAVTRLLQEKEQDLELAARIGQGLLEKNKKLESRNELLEQLLQEANDKIYQLRHDISMKDALLQVYVHDYESDGTPSPGDGTPGYGMGTMQTLQKKVKNLEDENLELKVQTARISSDTSILEEKEEHLMSDCVRHLEDLNKQMKEMEEELGARSELSVKQQEESTGLLSKVVNLEAGNRKLTVENTELQKHNEALENTQKELATEISQLEESYCESQAFLHEAKEEVKSLRKKAKPSVIHQHYGTAPFFMPEGSLALELKKTAHEEECPEGYKPSERRQHNKGVMETARCVRKTSRRTDSITSSISNMSLDASSISNRSSLYLGDVDSEGTVESDCGTSFSNGRPGIPGSNDLETALRKLALRRANEINESSLMAERAKRLESGDDDAPTPCQTPDSYMSIGSGSNLSDFSRLSGAFRMPEKLQIVKPMEGSSTLHQWQRLATPHLGGILDSRPGIQTKGGRKLDLGDEEIYSLSDFEEDGMSNLSFSACSDVGLGSLGESSTWWRDSGIILEVTRSLKGKNDNENAPRKVLLFESGFAEKREQLDTSAVKIETLNERFIQDGGDLNGNINNMSYYPCKRDIDNKRSSSNPWQWSSSNRCAIM